MGNGEDVILATGRRESKARDWAILGLTLLGLWVFAAYIGPWGEEHIPVFNSIVDTIEARDIDSGAYFYTEIEASYDGPRELYGSIEMMAPDRYGFTWPFITGLVICFMILFFGFKNLPTD
jgi:hypothetical protein